MKDIRHVFFDLDHTLWDFERSSHEALVELFGIYRPFFSEVEENEFIEIYRRNNALLWRQYEKRQVDSDDLRRLRWELTFDALSVPRGDWTLQMGLDYLDLCPRKPYLIDGALEMLEYVGQKYEVHLLTNGLTDTQSLKIEASGLDVFFKQVITSDAAQARKPDRKIFEYALEKSGSMRDHALYVGDNYESDVEGGLNAGWKVIFFNPGELENPVQAPQIKHLPELMQLI